MAAISKARGVDVKVATCPHKADPKAMDPKKTIKFTASPRARTQLGKAVCAETLNVVRTAIQLNPPRSAAI